jgi:hypothetical protein
MGFLGKLFGNNQQAATPKKSADAWCEEGNALGSRGQYNEAIACLENASG